MGNTDHMYTVTVTATDPFGAPVTSVVTITVTDVNEDPSVSGAASIDHAENGTELDIDAEMQRRARCRIHRHRRGRR